MEKTKEISALWKQIKPQIDEMVHLCYEVESHYEVTADAYQRGYEAGLKDAKEGKATCQFCEYEMCSDRVDPCRVCACNYKNFFEPKKQEKEEQFHVGDEFENESGKRFVIIKMNGNKIDRYVDEEGKTYCLFQEYRIMRKTGRHFPEIATVLKKIREGQDE